MNVAELVLFVHIAIEVVLIVRVLLRPNRQPASRVAWIVTITVLPVVGIIAYLLFGEVNVGRARITRSRRIQDEMPEAVPATADEAAHLEPKVPERHRHLFQAGHSIGGFQPVGGNRARLLPDSNAMIDALVADIDAAERHVHLLFYIWLPDGNGCKVVNALERAAQRGVVCRAMADALGSRLMIGSAHWKTMEKVGVRLAVALPVGNPLTILFRDRLDVRDHRKIVVIDGRITYCGSQNCADPEFRIKAKFAPWVDAMMRFEGPIAAQNQRLFAADWMAEVDEDLADVLSEPIRAARPGFPAQVIGTGPTDRPSAMPEMFESLMHAARRDLVITTPYYVPGESMQNALCAAAYRGVETTIIFPERNDSRIVSAASRSFYAELLAAGVRIYEYGDGLLHSKTLTFDDDMTLIGSANMDHRSFELNYENNILFCDAALTADVKQRQQDYLARSKRITVEDVAAWSAPRRLWNNAVAVLGPLL